jgi:hypothetical protein
VFLQILDGVEEVLVILHDRCTRLVVSLPRSG